MVYDLFEQLISMNTGTLNGIGEEENRQGDRKKIIRKLTVNLFEYIISLIQFTEIKMANVQVMMATKMDNRRLWVPGMKYCHIVLNERQNG